MTTVGYARVSTRDQDPGSQEYALVAAGAVRVFVDHGESSRIRRGRPRRLACLDFSRRRGSNRPPVHWKCSPTGLRLSGLERVNCRPTHAHREPPTENALVVQHCLVSPHSQCP